MSESPINQTTDTDRRLVLAERPEGEPTASTLRLETSRKWGQRKWALGEVDPVKL